MALPSNARYALGVLTGLWVTTGAAVPIGYLLLTAIKKAHGGELGPELLSRPVVALALLSGYGLAAAIGGWAAGWTVTGGKRRLFAFLGLAHVAMWLFSLAIGVVPLPSWFVVALAVASVMGSGFGIGVRAWQVERRAGNPSHG